MVFLWFSYGFPIKTSIFLWLAIPAIPAQGTVSLPGPWPVGISGTVAGRGRGGCGLHHGVPGERHRGLPAVALGVHRHADV